MNTTINRRQLATAFTGLLREIPWSHFGTFTFAEPKSHFAIQRTMEEHYFRRLNSFGTAVWWAYAIEGDGVLEHRHVHALLGGTSAYNTTQLERAWRAGHCDVTVYLPTGRAECYLTKQLRNRDIEIVLSPNLARIHRRVVKEEW